VAGLVAASAACAFVPAWAALLTGAVAGLLFLLGLYVWEQVLRIDDPSGTMATFALPGLWGVLALAVFADGRWGAGWNGVGAQEYLGIADQGVSGLLLARGYQAAGRGQFYAQCTGIGALLVVSLLLPWLLFKGALWVQATARRASLPATEPPPATEVVENAVPAASDAQEEPADAGSEPQDQ